jgi:hypothetical protein
MRIIKTEQEYNEAYERIYSLIKSAVNAIEPERTEGEISAPGFTIRASRMGSF